MAELKKCPFCGGEAEARKEINGIHWRVKCLRCSAEIGRYWFGSKKHAETAWNKRAAESESRASVIDEFEQRVKKICDERPIGIDEKLWIPLYGHDDGTWHSLIDDVVMQMKGEKE